MTRRYLIIDANIARSYADPARNEVAIACLLLLESVGSRASVIDVLVTGDLIEEWRRHASNKFKSWWAKMETRNRVRRVADKRLADYRSAIDSIVEDGVRDAMLKDAHIVEAAVWNHVPVASRDGRQLRYVKALAADYEVLRKVQWFDPVVDEGWKDWIESGCQDGSLFCCI